MLIEQLQNFLGSGSTVTLKSEKPWASITFSGTRYRFQYRDIQRRECASPSFDIARLQDHNFDLPGHFVADILVHNERAIETFCAIDILVIADPVSEKASDQPE